MGGAAAAGRGFASTFWDMPPIALAAVAGLVCALLYAPALQYGWVWDDATIAAQHGVVPSAFSLVQWLHYSEWHLGSGNPAIFHFTNLIVHGLGVALFFLFARHVAVSTRLAFLVALLFGGLPVHVESVAFITGRDAMLATVLILAGVLAARTATLCSPEGCRSRTIYWAYLLEALALRTHGLALVFPFLVVAVDRWGPAPVPLKLRRVHYSGFFAVWLVGLLVLFKEPLAPAATLVERGLPAGHAFAALAASAGEYVRMIACLSPLNAVRSLSPDAAAAASAWLPLLGGVLVVAAIAWSRRHDAAARCGAAVFALGILAVLPYPWTSNPFAAERLAYLASVGAVLLVASLLAPLASAPRMARAFAMVAILAVAAVAGLASAKRVPVWQDNVTLLQASAAASPHDPEPYLQLAEHHAAMNDPLAALSALDQAIERDPQRAESYSRRALVLGTLMRWPEAEASARQATKLDPHSAEAWANLGDALAQQGRAAEAVAASRHAIDIDSTQAPLWYNLGVSLGAMQDTKGAANAYERALAIDSTDVGAWNNLGALYGGMGRLDDARRAYAKAVDIAPNSLQARMNLALAYLRLGDKEAAARERDVIQRLDPGAARQLAEFFGPATPLSVAPPRPGTPGAAPPTATPGAAK